MDTTATIGMTSTPVLIVLLLVLALLLTGLLLSEGQLDRALTERPDSEAALSDEFSASVSHLTSSRPPDGSSLRR